MSTDMFSFSADDENRVLHIRLTGREPSTWYADRIIDTYRRVEDLWKYNRLVDHRRFDGLMHVEDLKRMAAVWLELNPGRRQARVGILTRNPLTRARINGQQDIYVNQVQRVFTNVEEAMVWLTEDVASLQPTDLTLRRA